MIYNADFRAFLGLGGLWFIVLEAMASEKVVVATDCGGVKEVVGGCGYLV